MRPRLTSVTNLIARTVKAQSSWLGKDLLVEAITEFLEYLVHCIEVEPAINRPGKVI